jgi:acetyl-CoA C-acetyltransferase
MREAVLVSAVRTPVGKCRGTLASIPAHKLGALSIKEAVRRINIDPMEIDEVIFGNLFANEIANMARMAALEAKLPITVPGITIDRQCGSGLNAIAYAAILIQAGYADIIVAGGVESDSRRPYVMNKAESAYQIDPPKLFSTRRLAPDEIGDPTMIMTAENVAKKYNISRDECDEFAYRSHIKAANAWENGYFNTQIVEVNIKQNKSNSILFREDETVRKNTNLEVLGKLPTIQKGEKNVVTAGNSSPMSDGASAVVVMEKEKAKSMGIEILATFRGYSSVGVDPNIMGIGPVYSTRKVLRKLGFELKDIDLIEINEAFASQSIACIRELELDANKVNVNGGAIALGHPLSATGAILTTKMVYELKRRKARFGLITFCCGGGQGISVIIENENEN